MHILVHLQENTIISFKNYLLIIYYVLDMRLAVKRNEGLIHTTTRVNLEDIRLSKLNQTQKDEYCMISLI